MKKSDNKIISLLRQNGRIKLTEISKKSLLPVSTIHERIRKHIKDQLIRPSALINFNKIGYTSSAHILLSVEQQDKEELFKYLKNSTQVNSLYRVNNGWNIMMEGIFKDMYELEAFMEKIEHKYKIKEKQVHYVLDEIKREGFLSQPELVEL